MPKSDHERSRWIAAVRALLLSSAALALCGRAPVAAQELIVNGGFESPCISNTQICSPWVFTGSSRVIGGVTANSGVNSAQVKQNAPGTIDQMVTLPKPGTYSFSFWWNTFNPGNTEVTASVGGQTVFDQVVVQTHVFQQVSAQLQLTAPSADVLFTAQLGSVTLFVDDVSLMLVSPLTLTSMLQPGAPVNPTNVARDRQRQHAAGRLL